MKFADFTYAVPATLDEAVALLVANPGEAKVLSGGQSLLPTMAFRLAQPRVLVDLKKLAALRGIEVDGEFVRVGARTRWCDIEDSALIAAELPMVAAAMKFIAHYQIRNRGTIGGSLAHADPAAESPCLALVHDAEMDAVGPGGLRVIPAAAFCDGPLTTVLAEDEILVAVRFPRWPAERRWAFKEVSRRAGDFALAGVALRFDLDAKGLIRSPAVGVFGAGPTPLRIADAERALEGRALGAEVCAAAAKAAAAGVEPADDLHAPADYRRGLVATLVERALAEAAAK
jgi:carbon-monoxide dehydrogenase medium subunit